MKNKAAILLLVSLTLVNYGYCYTPDSVQNKIHFGVAGVFNQGNSLAGDLYVGRSFLLLGNQFETNLGYSYFRNTTKYNVVDEIVYYSHGFYGEGNYFLTSSIYAGLRINLNMNWVDSESQRKFDNVNDVAAPTFFTGNATFVQVGFIKSLGSRMSLKLQGQLGIHKYKIAEDAIYFNNSSDRLRDAQYGIEHHTDFLYNLSAGLVIKL